MNRRVVAAILLFAAVVSCVSQGLAVVVCKCSGDAFLGSAPESCCAHCETDVEAEILQVAGAPMPACSTDCFVVIAKAWETYPPASDRLEAPRGTDGTVESVADSGNGRAWQRDAGRGSWTVLHAPAPPGRPRASLHGSLRL